MTFVIVFAPAGNYPLLMKPFSLLLTAALLLCSGRVGAWAQDDHSCCPSPKKQAPEIFSCCPAGLSPAPTAFWALPQTVAAPLPDKKDGQALFNASEPRALRVFLDEAHARAPPAGPVVDGRSNHK